MLEFYNQRNDQLYPSEVCGIAAYLNMYLAAGYPEELLEKIPGTYKQPEDRCVRYFEKSTDLQNKLRATCYKGHAWEVHDLLYQGMTEVLYKACPSLTGRVTYYPQGLDLNSIYNYLDIGASVLVSTKVADRKTSKYLDHLVCLTKLKTNKIYVIDSWGNMLDGYCTHKVEPQEVNWQFLVSILKPLGNFSKLCHVMLPNKEMSHVE